MNRRDFIKTGIVAPLSISLAGCQTKQNSLEDSLTESTVINDIYFDDTILVVSFESSPYVTEKNCRYDPILEMTQCERESVDVEVVKWGIRYPNEEGQLEMSGWDWTEEVSPGKESKTVDYDMGTLIAGDFAIGAGVKSNSWFGEKWTEFYFSLDYSDSIHIINNSTGYSETF